LRAGSHDRGRVIRDLAVMLADGGDCVADLRAVSDQAVLFGATASPSTAFRVIDRIACTPGLLDALRDAHARARARVWELAGAPVRLTIDLDATLITAHSEKDRAAGTFKGSYGFAPMLAYCDETGEALAGELRSGNAGANNAADQIAVAEQAVAQIPPEHIETIELLLRVDSAGACHELLDWCREGQIEFSVGYDWPTGSRVIVRRERAHPGAQLSFTDIDGHRFQAILTDQTGPLAAIERDHRGRARVEDHIRNDKDTGLRNMPFRAFEHNQVWLQVVALAHDLIVWTQRLLLTGALAKAEPKRLRYQLLHIAARLAFHARTATLRLPASWPWAQELATAFKRLKALPAPA